MADSLLQQNVPLASRLRAEAAEWDTGESIPPLLLEAAEAIELLAAHVATLEWETRHAKLVPSTDDGWPLVSR